MYMSFNVVIHSSDAIENEGKDGTNVNPYAESDQLSYAIDWSFMDDCDYELTFTFRCNAYKIFQADGTTATSFDNAVFCSATHVALSDLGAQFKNFKAGRTQNANNTNTIGLLTNHLRAMDSMMSQTIFTTESSNAPSRVSKPVGNQFTVKLLDNQSRLAVRPPPQYDIILHFKKNRPLLIWRRRP